MDARDNRQKYRDMGGGKNLASPFNEAWSFTIEEYGILQATRPELFDRDPVAKTKAWRAFALTSEGRAFRVR